MTRIRQFGRFWYDFVIGDDWRLAVGAACALAIAGGAGHAGLPAWWVAPFILATLLALSVVRATARGS